MKFVLIRFSRKFKKWKPIGPKEPVSLEISCSFFVDFTVERTGEYRSRHEWMLADKDVVQELILYIKRLFANQIQRKWILLIAETKKLSILFFDLCYHFEKNAIQMIGIVYEFLNAFILCINVPIKSSN